MDTEDLIEKKVKIMILLCIMMIMLAMAMLPRMVNQVIKICSYKQTASLNVDDKYYQNSRWETAIKLLLIVMMKKKKLQFQKKNFTQLKSEIKYCVMYIVQ